MAQLAGADASAGRDPQIGHIFRNMRAAMRLSREALARRLVTTTVTIDDFESGSLTALPHWKETVRIVRAYCEPLRLDPEPILWRLQTQLSTATAPPAASTRPPAPPHASGADPARRTQFPPPPLSVPHADAPKAASPPQQRRSRARTLFALSAPFALLAALVLLAHLAPAPDLSRSSALLPAPMDGALRSGHGYPPAAVGAAARGAEVDRHRQSALA